MAIKCFAKAIVLGFIIVIVSLLPFNINIGYENELLFLILNFLFTGIIPLIVAMIAGRAYFQDNEVNALLMCCGMLIFGLGSIVTGMMSLFTNSINMIATIYSICALGGATFHMIASVVKSNSIAKVDHKKGLIAVGLSGIGLFLVILVIATQYTLTPLFYDEHGSTQLRESILWLSSTFYFSAFVNFSRQYRERKQEFLCWYALALFLFSLGLFSVCISPALGTPLGWVGRFALYTGAVYALISILLILQKVKDKESSLSGMMKQFFGGSEDVVRQSEILLRTIIEGIPGPVFLKDHEGRFIMGNTGLSLSVGASICDVVGKTDMQIHQDYDTAKMIMDHDAVVFRSNSAQVFEEIVATPSGERIFLSSKTPWYDENGTIIGIIGVSHDITERKEMEDRLDQQAKELLAKNKQITDFFTNLSHELKNPLSLILLCVDLLESNHFDVRGITVMKRNCYRLARLVMNLLDVSKVEAGFVEPNWEYIDVNQYIALLFEPVNYYAEQKGITIECTVSKEKQFIYTDSFMFERIILNLISNAIKYTPRGGWILVTCFVSTEKVLISVKDNGEGIPDDKKEIIFNRFMQADSSSLTRSKEGCGIGLALTKSLVELLQGRIWFESKEGVGSEFFVELPILKLPSTYKTVDLTEVQFDKTIQMEFSDFIL